MTVLEDTGKTSTETAESHSADPETPQMDTMRIVEAAAENDDKDKVETHVSKDTTSTHELKSLKEEDTTEESNLRGLTAVEEHETEHQSDDSAPKEAAPNHTETGASESTIAPTPDVSTNEKENEETTTVKKPIVKKSLSQIKTVFPIDAKLLQYCYLSRKTVAMIVIIKKVKESLSNPETPLVDPQSIILLAGPIFNINDNFYRRSEILQNCQKYNPAQTFDVPLVLSPISFDSLENISRNNPVGPYGITLDKVIPLPNRKKILDTVTLLELLLLSVYEITNARFNIALNQANRQHGTTETKQSIIQKLESIQFTELNIIEQLIFKEIPDIPSTQQENILMYYLENQFNFLEVKLATYQNIVDGLKQEIRNSLIAVAKIKAGKPLNLQSVPLYTMYTVLLRIADLYVEIRKMGKTVYFQNVNYFSAYSRSRKTVKDALIAMSIYFSHSKQNSMILALISKYSRRTEIKNVSLDFDIFVTEFKKTSIETVALLDRMMVALREIHNEWTLIVKDGKANEFNKDVLREKMRLRVNSEREKRSQLLLEKQRKMQVEMTHLRAGSITPSDVEHDNTRNKLMATRRVSSINSLNSIGENSTTPGTINNPKLRRTSLTPGSATPSRNSSLTGSVHSPFYRSASAGIVPASTSASRTNSLTGTRQKLCRRSSVGDFRNTARLAEMGSISESSSTFNEPPRIGGHTVQRKGSYGSLTSTSSSRTSSLTRQSTYRSPSLTSRTQPPSTATPPPPPSAGAGSRSPSLTRQSTFVSRPPTAGSRANSLTSSPSAKTREMLQRRSSVVTPQSSSSNLRSQAGSTPQNTTVRRRLSNNGLPSTLSEEHDAQIKAAGLAAKRNSTQNLTAQQRLQQHILKSAQNGSVYGKPLEAPPKRTYASQLSSPSKINTDADEFQLPKTLDDHVNDALKINPDLQITPSSPTDLNGETLTAFPGSPLNSLKASSLEAQNALKLQMVNRSRSNSNTNATATPVNRARVNSGSPSKPSLSPSPSRARSRSNSQLSKLTRQTSVDSSGSVSDISRRNSVSSSMQGRTRSSSIMGNMDVVSESEIGGEFKVGIDGEIIKRVRFAGVSHYSEDEDAPTPQQMQKQIKQKWAAYKPLFRKLNSQEGQAFKQNHNEDEQQQQQPQNGNGSGPATPQKNYGGGLVTGSMNATYGGIGVNPNMMMAQQGAINVNGNGYGSGKVSMMDMITSNAENEAAQNMSSKTLRRETGGGNAGNATNRLSRLFRKR